MDPFHPYFGIEWYWLLGAWAALSIGAHMWQVGYIVRLIRLGGPDDRFNAWPVRMREFLRDWLGQRKVIEDRLAGGAHALIFWGFLLLVSDVLDLGTGGMLAVFLEDIYLKDFWNIVVDIGYLLAGTGITIALYRRVVLRPAKLRGASIEGELILLAIMGIILTAFLLEGAAMIDSEGALAERDGWEPVGALFASFMINMDPAMLQTWVDASFWLHMLLIGGFLVEIPQTKHSHLLGTIPNVLFQDHAPLGKQKPLQMAPNGLAVSTDDLDIENLSLGTSNYSDFSWRQISDGWACTACARCQDVCPAFASGKGLNPMQIIFDVKDYGWEHGRQLLAGETPEESLIDRFSEEAIWACTTCFACVDACPVHIEHVPKLTDARRHLVMEAAQFPNELQAVFENLERNSNPWGFGAHTRGDWAEGLELKVGEPAEYLFYVGCAGSFDNRNKQVSRTLARLMQQADVDFSILGETEMCNGDLARRSGNEFLIGMIAGGPEAA
ncbi:MAG: (Fe-S)-binding protein [Candidatus Poseidoniia archaeon]|nr:(Fe-S)-binding protein [Candidatus Poseidoniia archaeon]